VAVREVGALGTADVILIVKREVVVARFPSVTRMVKVFDDAAFVGVPEITPVAPARVRPLGNSESSPKLHVYVSFPPDAASVTEYAEPLEADPNELVVIEILAETTMVTFEVVETPFESVIVTAIVLVPVVTVFETVPEIVPDDRVNPVGREPLTTENV
jgi:hypothetical protein